MKYVYYVFFKAFMRNGTTQEGGIVITSESKINSQEVIDDIQSRIAQSIFADSVIICNINLLDECVNNSEVF